MCLFHCIAPQTLYLLVAPTLFCMLTLMLMLTVCTTMRAEAEARDAPKGQFEDNNDNNLACRLTLADV